MLTPRHSLSKDTQLDSVLEIKNNPLMISNIPRMFPSVTGSRKKITPDIKINKTVRDMVEFACDKGLNFNTFCQRTAYKLKKLR